MTMKATITKRTITLAGAAGVTAAMLAAATLLVATQRPAQAFPAYAQKTGYECGVCHVNPKGGGALNAYGTKWFTGGMKPLKPPKKK
jgi:mono/diheme cytochrome c family protein